MKVIDEQVSHQEQSFRFLQLELPAFEGAWHRHPQAELTWIRRGAGLRFVGDDVSPFVSDDLVLIGSNLPHAWLGGPDESELPYRATVLQFRTDLFSTANVPEWSAVQTLLATASTGLAIREPCKSIILRLMHKMAEVTSLNRLSLLLEALDLLVANPDSMQTIASSRSLSLLGADQRIETLISWIQKNLHLELRIEEAARLVHISPLAFSRFFHNSMGKPFTVYLNDLRCADAAMQLRTSKKSIAHIAEACGFQTLSHFNRQFRIRYGKTPRELRRRN